MNVASLIHALRGRIADLLRNQSGQGLAEYALIIVLIAILSIIALTLIGFQISGELSNIGSSV